MSPLALACGRWQSRSIPLCASFPEHGDSLQHSGALSAAAGYGKINVVRWFLEKGTDVNDVVGNVASVK